MNAWEAFKFVNALMKSNTQKDLHAPDTAYVNDMKTYEFARNRPDSTGNVDCMSSPALRKQRFA